MKNLIVLVFILITKITLAQQTDTVGLNTPFINGEVAYQKVFNAPNKPGPLLFSNAQLWFVKHYKTLNSIQIQDDVVGRVVGKGVELLTFKGMLGINGGYDVDMTIQIDCKDGRYRTRIFNIVIETEDINKVKTYTNAEHLMNDLLGIKTTVVAANYNNPLNKNQSKRALQSLNVLVDNVMGSINQIMNDNDNF
ncbi:DUF4468 domain-containing protein [Mucilaginibacter sp.]|uniref:DUF4468 domain-containing protein n=1 Tax=Mucilaginibacter sp. TaxID=1882438 RepID=UPI002603D8A8|nr:DUF4468 domain-containing protein [Mucilaginibacter sp.]MDB4926441.1 hypothetical protein [Mucilaginibacter sp.]